MSIESAIRLFAGSIILLSLLLYWLLGPWSLLLTGFVGLNLIQSSLTGFCPAEKVFAALGVGRSSSGSCGVASGEKTT